MVISRGSEQQKRLLLSVVCILAVGVIWLAQSVVLPGRIQALADGKRSLAASLQRVMNGNSAGWLQRRSAKAQHALAASTVKLSAEEITVSEGAGFAPVSITRAGDSSAAATVDYETLNGTADQRKDYVIAAGTIRFAAGETTKIITVLINDNTYLDGKRSLYVQLRNANGADLGLPALATITINDNDTMPPAANLLEDAHAFVGQHYYDFLSRYPDQGGWDYWTSQISQCGGNVACLHSKRIDVSNAFFYELEFQQTAAYVFRLYRAAYGNDQPFPSPDNSNQAEAKKLPSYAVFVPDRAQVVGGSSLAQSQADLGNAFVQRSEFLSRYAAGLPLDQFVDALLQTIRDNSGADLALQRNQLIALGSRGAVLYRIADDNLQSNPINNRAFIDAEYNRAFVFSQYAGYLRRDSDIGGFLFWLGQVNSAPLRDVPKQQAMVCSFITSQEYQERFSPVSNHSNADCSINGPSGNHPPSVNAGVTQTIALPLNNVTLGGVVTDDGLPVGGVLSAQWAKVSGPGNVNFSNPNAAITMATFSAEGKYLLRLFASDTQLTNAAYVQVKILPANVPPDPAGVAPPIDDTIATTIYDSTKFLYTGNPPIQTGVAPGTIKPKQAAVLRGRVVGRDGEPLPGAKVTILNHLEFGQTFSRADGMFDMAVNGGGLLTVNLAKEGYLPLQRQMDVPWQDYEMVPDVCMIAADPNVTTIDLTANVPIQVARSGRVLDSPAPRQSTLLFKQGTTATMTLPGGGTQPLTSLHVRSTEYTVGQMGPMAMPGALPGTSAYTYAAEYSIDEAIAAGAVQVDFSQPVAQYNENFLNFPVGTSVPSGSYDKLSGFWKPSTSGRVVKILSVSGGQANLDITGGGTPASDAELTALGINAAERQHLATLFPVGQLLWRVPVNHFSPWDSNWPYGPPPDAEPPSGPPTTGDYPPDDEDECDGCILGVQDQRLSQEIDLTGTHFFLRYNSTRSRGRVSHFTARIPLSGPTLSGPVKRIELTVTIAGQMHAFTFPAQANQSTTFTWDGKDAYGRTLQGQHKALIDIGNVYDGVYQNAGNFGYNGNGIPITGNQTRQEITIHRRQSLPLGIHSAPPESLGGWTLSVNHAYDTEGQTLYEGNGKRRSVQTVSNGIETVGGTVSGFSGDGGQVRNAQLKWPNGLAVGPDGSVYVADSGNSRIRKIAPDGIITTFAGNGGGCNPSNFPCGEGGPAANASFGNVGRVAVAPDGSVYIGSGRNVWRVTTDGVFRRVAGIEIDGFSGDGGQARDAKISNATRFYPAVDGSIYISDQLNQRIRRIDPNGIISTIAGTGTQGFSGDGGPATQATISYPGDLVAAPDGNVYFLDQFPNNRIRRIGPDGIITTIAGNGTYGNSGDGGPALLASFAFDPTNPIETGSLSLAPDGSLYVVSFSLNAGRIRRIGTDGIVTAVAGNGQFGSQGDGGPALQSQMRLIAMALAPDGSIYTAGGFSFDFDESRIRKISPPLPAFDGSNIAIPSEDGTQLFRFDANGRHLTTVNTLTGATVYTFAYDSAGRLASVTDGDNNVTTIERDGSGNPTGILSPYNQRTTFTRDSNGYLATIANPANDQYQFSYNAAGLMTSERDPRGNQNQFTYDAMGRLTRDDDPAMGFQTLSRTDAGVNFTVTRNTALNRPTSYQIQNLSNSDRRRLNTYSDGTTTNLLERANAVNTYTEPDGTVTEETRGSDPRFKFQAPLGTKTVIATPGGLNYNATLARSATLSNPADLLSLTTLTDTRNINGRIFTRAFTAASRTFATTSAQSRTRSATIDTQGRTTQFQFADLNAGSFTYDLRGRLSVATLGNGGVARTINLAYNPAGFLSSVTNPLNQTTSFAYDLAGRLTQRALADNRQIALAYDARGNLTSLTPPGKPAHTFTYTPINLVATYLAPSIGGSSTTTFAYNLDRQITRITRPDALQINYSYDGPGRLQTVTVPSGSYGLAYNATTGLVNSITAPGGGVVAYQYDGFLPVRQTWTGAVAGSVLQTYDNNFRIASQSINSANTINFTYDNDDLLTGAGSLTLNRNTQNGLLSGTALSNVSDTFTYNGFAEPTNYNAKFNTTSLYNADYSYDKLGRVTQKVESIGGLTTTYAYAYDSTGRLTTVTLNGGPQPQVTYNYDSNDNRLSVNLGGLINGTYDAQDRLTQYGNTAYTYTANGELQSKTNGGQTTLYSYDVIGNLRNVTLPNGTAIEYLIDGQDRRIGKRVNGTLTQGFLYQDQLEPVAELDTNNNILSRFVYGSHQNTPDYMIKGGVTYRFITDHLGSVRLVVDVATGVIAQRIDYDEFGVVLTDTNPGFQPFGFAGGLYDTQTRLTRLGARDYDAETGRWTAKDPILFDGHDTNLYSYAFADPINFVDVDGFEPGQSGKGKDHGKKKKTQCRGAGGGGGPNGNNGPSGGGNPSGGGPNQAGGGSSSGGGPGSSGSSGGSSAGSDGAKGEGNNKGDSRSDPKTDEAIKKIQDDFKIPDKPIDRGNSKDTVPWFNLLNTRLGGRL